jgi:hypothetical protein
MSVLSALSEMLQPMPGLGGSNDHVTKKITLYALTDWITNPSLQVNLWDTWGVSSDTFNFNFLDRVLDGSVPDGYEMQSYKDGKYQASETADTSEKTAVLFFVKAAQTHDDELMQDLKNITERLSQRGYSPLVVVSWLREVAVNDRAKTFQKLGKLLQIPESRLFPFYGYVDERAKNTTVDKNVLEILEETVRQSDNFVKAHARQKANMRQQQLNEQQREQEAADKVKAEQASAQRMFWVKSFFTGFAAIATVAIFFYCYKYFTRKYSVVKKDGAGIGDIIDMPLGYSAATPQGSEVNAGGSIGTGRFTEADFHLVQRRMEAM